MSATEEHLRSRNATIQLVCGTVLALLGLAQAVRHASTGDTGLLVAACVQVLLGVVLVGAGIVGRRRLRRR